ncbi:lytic transglycosylase domain-containing protein [Woodsholea maritima]|uniref:lytic transglycosylase domain-containing protein n=1 Tax=Woodsholea maritima TaxID=240237 RepID=UPI00036B3ECF|nr:lytic transglycosylase domain-containing protein [Woodsholea maritima]
MTEARAQDVLTSVLRTTAPGPVRFIAEAAQATGADFDYLLRTAARESNFDQDAKARTSSASGLFQFIDQTWLATFSEYGAKHGQGELAGAISRDGNGRFSVSDPAKRRQILDMRFDPEMASRLAGELTAQNSASLSRQLGREPNGAELYMAHFLGAGGAGELLTLADTQPEARAAEHFPAAAAANRSIFYDHGRARSVRDVVAILSRHHEGQVNLPEGPREPIETLRPDQQGVYAFAGVSRAAPNASVPGSVAEISPLMIEILASLKGPEDNDPPRRA